MYLLFYAFFSKSLSDGTRLRTRHETFLAKAAAAAAAKDCRGRWGVKCLSFHSLHRADRQRLCVLYWPQNYWLVDNETGGRTELSRVLNWWTQAGECRTDPRPIQAFRRLTGLLKHISWNCVQWNILKIAHTKKWFGKRLVIVQHPEVIQQLALSYYDIADKVTSKSRRGKITNKLNSCAMMFVWATWVEWWAENQFLDSRRPRFAADKIAYTRHQFLT